MTWRKNKAFVRATGGGSVVSKAAKKPFFQRRGNSFYLQNDNSKTKSPERKRIKTPSTATKNDDPEALLRRLAEER